VIRFVLLGTHYRKPMDWTEQKRREAKDQLDQWAMALAGVAPDPVPSDEIVETLAQDLNTHGAITILRRDFRDGELGRLKANLGLLGIDLVAEERAATEHEDLLLRPEQRRRIMALLDARQAARQARDYARADAIRIGLADAGVIVADVPGGQTWKLGDAFDPARLEELP